MLLWEGGHPLPYTNTRSKGGCLQFKDALCRTAGKKLMGSFLRGQVFHNDARLQVNGRDFAVYGHLMPNCRKKIEKQAVYPVLLFKSTF